MDELSVVAVVVVVYTFAHGKDPSFQASAAE